MESSPIEGSLGPWQGDDLAATVARYAGEGSDDDLDRVSRFGRNVCRLALRRQTQSRVQVRDDAIAIFLLQPRAPAGTSTRREPMLGDGGVEVCGKIWFANLTVRSGRALAAECEEDGAMFEQVEALGLGSVPAVVFNPTIVVPTVRIYRKGLSQDHDIELIDIADAEIDITRVRAVIDWVASEHLATPESQVPKVSMWKDAPRFWASIRAEAIAQLQLKTALSLRFFQCEIRAEQPSRAGRTDLEIVQRRVDGTTVVPAEIEIKVLRERTSTGRQCTRKRTERWMRHGVRQVAAYRDARGARCGLLCCFDMRSRDEGEHATFLSVRTFADRLRVVLHRNFLYNSAAAWREVHYPN